MRVELMSKWTWQSALANNRKHRYLFTALSKTLMVSSNCLPPFLQCGQGIQHRLLFVFFFFCLFFRAAFLLINMKLFFFHPVKWPLEVEISIPCNTHCLSLAIRYFFFLNTWRNKTSLWKAEREKAVLQSNVVVILYCTARCMCVLIRGST